MRIITPAVKSLKFHFKEKLLRCKIHIFTFIAFEEINACIENVVFAE